MPNRTLANIAPLSISLIMLASIAVPASAATFLNGVTLDQTSNAQPNTTPAPAQQTPIGQGNTPVQTPIGQGNTPTSASGNNSGTLLVNPVKVGSLPELLDIIVNAIVDIGTIVLILALIWVGFSFVKAQGKEKEIAQARAALLWTIIGGAILLGAKALSEVIQSTVSNI